MPPPSPSPQLSVNLTPQILSTETVQAPSTPTIQKVQIIDQEILKPAKASNLDILEMPLNTKLAVPLALGFSIVSVTAFVLYYIFKKEETTLDKSVKTSRSNVIEVSVPKANVAALIGKYQVDLEIQRDTDPDISSPPEPVWTR
ncbi:unnamed protein product [Leptidea sinapis]|uniref:Uncharacterized protein n=1 Tax=Leptidea sinapis TaxID=189913 RepID=A0A5E4PRY7_9NEOP|nr:unnamed protein product [Leptidea sinapis]